MSPKKTSSVLQSLEESLTLICDSNIKNSESYPGDTCINATMAALQVHALESVQFMSGLQNAGGFSVSMKLYIQIITLNDSLSVLSICASGWASRGHHLDSNEWRFRWSQSSKESHSHRR